MNKINNVVIEIGNLTNAQLIAIEDMLATWKYLSNVGSSRWVAFFVDGDGNFNPDILIDGKLPEKTKLLTHKELWYDVKVKVPPTKENGLSETMWHQESEFYMIDFDDVAGRIPENE